jgi:hypothetical protein
VRVVVFVGVALLVIVASGVAVARLLDRGSSFETAVALAPRSTLRALYTDWAGVRTIAGGRSLGPSSSRHAVNQFLERAYDHDLVAASALTSSTYALEHRFGVSPMNAQWELYAQSRQGAVDILKVGESVDLAGVERNLRMLGYDPPASGSGTGGVWAGTADLVARIDPALTPEQQNVVVMPEQRLVLMSDSESYASAAAEVVRGERAGLDETEGTMDLAGQAEHPVNAVMWASDFACADLSMGKADAEDQRVAEDLVQRAGETSPLSGLVMSQQANGDLVVAMHFESEDQASENLQPRTDLAAGEAPGQGGTFAERFSVVSAEARGPDVVLRLHPHGQQALLSDLYQGPVLFATC